MANPHLAAAELSSAPSIYHDKGFLRRHREINDAIRRDDKDYLRARLKEGGPVNLSKDPLINVLIMCRKSGLVTELLAEVPPEELLGSNHDGDTALHVAAMKGDIVVAEGLMGRNGELVKARNNQSEIPLHKAALYGERPMFWKLVEHGSAYDARREDGATVLHCAIMGNAPKLALEIASKYPELTTRVNSRAVTPLQLIVTIPQAFRSKIPLGPLEALIYKWIPLPLEESDSTCEIRKGDEEELQKPYDGENSRIVAEGHHSKSPPATSFRLVSLAYVPVRWLQVLLFRSLKKFSSRVEELEQLKMNHKQAMKLIGHLAGDPDYWDFIVKGRTREEGSRPPSQELLQLNPFQDTMPPVPFPDTMPPMPFPDTMPPMPFPDMMPPMPYPDTMPPMPFPDTMSPMPFPDTMPVPMPFPDTMPPIHNETKNIQNKDGNSDTNRWNESPLTLGAKMGLHEFVQEILTVCPQSAVYLDTEGRNFLQVAIQNGHKRIVRIVEKMATGANPVLPSWLLSSIDKKTKNTILHFAAEETVKTEAGALQMQCELQWFERVQKLIPKDLEHSRNEKEETAQELFTENHKSMVKNGKTQLMEMGKTCSSLVAAVVFASSFSIPGEKDNNNNPVFYNKTAFKVFTHAYVVGLSCASTALVLFLSLLTSPYREQDFRRSLPTKYFLANMSLFLSLVALLVAFSCNIYLNIYGGKKAEMKDIVPLVCELTIFPGLCCLVLIHRGCTFGATSFFRHVWR